MKHEIIAEYNNIFDSHVHYDDPRFKDDYDSIITSFPDFGIIGATNIGADMQTSRNSISLASKYSNIYATVGVHPHGADDMEDDDLIELSNLAEHKKCVAIGEIGLDYYYNNSTKEAQIKRFHDQMKLATKLDLPVVIHSRKATADTIEIIKQYNRTCVIHSFSGSVESAKIYLNMGMYIGFTGVITFKNAIKMLEVAKMVPLDKFLIETDAPYMAPHPFRGKRSDSTMVYKIPEKIAELKNMDVQEIINNATKNTKFFYGI